MTRRFSEVLRRSFVKCVGALLAISLSATSVSAGDASGSAPVLTLDDAIQLAMNGNRTLKIAELEVVKSEDTLASARTHRLPAFSTTALASQLMTPIDFQFSQGAFGTYPGIGPIPAQNTDINTPLRPVYHIEAEMAQPIVQLYKIHLGLLAQAATIAVDREQVRAQRQELADSVNSPWCKSGVIRRKF